MSKQELGTKRLCGHCGAKFYDLHLSPITCPKCGTAVEIAFVSSRFASAERASVPEGGAETSARKEVQFSSLEDAEAVEGEADTVETDDGGLIEQVEEDGPEVTDFIEDNEDHE
jgi:uncharacterized protein (TIGR02300 family)